MGNNNNNNNRAARGKMGHQSIACRDAGWKEGDSVRTNTPPKRPLATSPTLKCPPPSTPPILERFKVPSH